MVTLQARLAALGERWRGSFPITAYTLLVLAVWAVMLTLSFWLRSITPWGALVMACWVSMIVDFGRSGIGWVARWAAS